MIKKNYDKLKSKYDLPNFERLNSYFFSSSYDEDIDILPQIRESIQEKFGTYVEIMENVLYPDSSLKSNYESHYLTDKDRSEIYTLYKEMIVIIRSSEIIAIENNELDNAEFIKKSFKKWEFIKDSLSEKIKALRDVWRKETDIKTDKSYFG